MKLQRVNKINLFLIIGISILAVFSFNPYLLAFGNAIVIYRDKPRINSWARWLVYRTMKKNDGNLVSVVGKTGSGKTWSAISVCQIMSEMDGVPFTIEHIVFNMPDLMRLINSGKLKRGSKIIFDEPQVSIGARDFQSKANKLFNYLATTMRHRNLTVFFCTPFETLLDKNTRRLFHAKFETQSINRNNNTCRIIPRYTEWVDWKKDEPLRKKLIVMFKENGNDTHRKLDYWDVPKPTADLIEQYEAKKLEFTNTLNQNIEEDLMMHTASGKSLAVERVKDDTRKELTDKQKQAMYELANCKESNKQDYVAKKIGISTSALNQRKIAAEEKCYTLEEFKEK